MIFESLELAVACHLFGLWRVLQQVQHSFNTKGRLIPPEFLHTGHCSEAVHGSDLKQLVVETAFDGKWLAKEVLIAVVSLHDLVEHCRSEVVRAQSS